MKEHVHEALLKVKRLATPDQPRAICELLNYEFSSLLDEGFRAWPDFSGRNAYPVVELESDLAKELFSRTADKCAIAKSLHYRLMPWADTPYGRKRRELLDFLIDWTKPCAES